MVTVSVANRIYERDTDALFLRLLRGDAEFRRKFLSSQEKGLQSEVTVIGQKRHLRGSGSIDIAISYVGGPLFLIENKIDAAYSVTQQGHGQVQRYQQTVAAYREQGVEAFSVLVAPSCYISASRFAPLFDLRVSYESLYDVVSGSERLLLESAVRQAESPYEPVPDSGAGSFFAEMRRFIIRNYPDLVMKRDPNADGVRPVDSRTVYFDVPRTLRSHLGVNKPRMSLQCWDSAAPSASVKIMMSDMARLADELEAPQSLSDIGAYLRRAGRSMGIVIDTPRLENQAAFDTQVGDVVEALEASLRLQKWWNENNDVLRQWSNQR